MMASKTIMIQEDTYNNLLALKKENESFNDLINRLIYYKQDLTPFFGLLEDIDLDKLDQAIQEIREKNDNEDTKRK